MPSKSLASTLHCFGRSRKRNKSGAARSYSLRETGAWRNRPYGCKSLEEALKHYDAMDINLPGGDVCRRNIALTVIGIKKRQAEWARIPEWCYPHEHPLRTGRPGKMYHKSDIIGPIVDAMQRMEERVADYDVFGVLEAAPKKRKVSIAVVGELVPDMSLDAHRMRRASEVEELKARGGVPMPRWKCESCGNTDEKSQVVCNEATVCPCGIVVCMGSIVSTHREKLGASEAEDKTQHADRPHEDKTDKYDRPPQTTEERRAARRCSGKISNIGGRSKGSGRLCNVQRISEQMAAKETDTHQTLDQRQILKLQRILEETERMFIQLSPVDHAVKRAVRRAVDVIWNDCAVHSGCCSNAGCELRLADRSAFIIAAAVFEITIDRLITRELEPDQISHEHVVDLQTRMQRSAAFNNSASLTQMATAKVMIRLMQEPEFDACVQCQQCTPVPATPRDRASGKKLASIRTTTRCESFSFRENSPPPSENLQFRDALSKVFLAHKCELPTAVRDGAMKAMQSAGFVSGCKGIEVLKPYSITCVAFCALVAIARVQSDQSTSFSAPPAPLNVALAGKLGLDLAHAEEAIQVIKGMVPSDAASEASDRGDDDIFS